MDRIPEAPEWTAGSVPRIPTRRQAISTCAFALLSALCSAGLVTAAVLMHPPVAVVPLLVIVCAGCPVFGTWELAPAVAALRAKRLARHQAIAMLRAGLAQLPEIEHPLGG
jgi:hypothetical protein